MRTIKNREGKSRGETGVTIHIYKQRTKPMETKTITVHGIEVNQLHEKILFFLKTFSKEGKYSIIKEV